MLSAGLSCVSAGMGNAITVTINAVTIKSAESVLAVLGFIFASFDTFDGAKPRFLNRG
jgi:hypothetical protein